MTEKIGIVRKDNEAKTRAKNDPHPVGECLRTGAAGSSRAMVMHFAGQRIQESLKELEYCVRSGEPAFRLRGVTNIFEDPKRTPEEEAIFDAAMADLTSLIT